MMLVEAVTLHQAASAEFRKIERLIDEMEPMSDNVREYLIIAGKWQIIANMGLGKCKKAAYLIGKDIPLDHPVFVDYARVVSVFHESLLELVYTCLNSE